MNGTLNSVDLKKEKKSRPTIDRVTDLCCLTAFLLTKLHVNAVSVLLVLMTHFMLQYLLPLGHRAANLIFGLVCSSQHKDTCYTRRK